MKLLDEPLGSRHRLTWLLGAIALAACALLAVAARANASETIYWNNFTSGGVAFANIDGTGGGELNVTGTAIEEPEGMAFDPVNDRLYIAGLHRIEWVSIDGTGGGVLDTGVAPLDRPVGIGVDPETQTVYWANKNGGGSIGYAAADESGVGGTLNTTGASPGSSETVALDMTDGRIYWISSGPGGEHLSYANLDNSGGADVAVPEEQLPEEWSGLNVDPATQRLYILAGKHGATATEDFVYWINLSGVGGSEVDTANASFHEPYGLAFDPSLGRFYWGNYNYEAGELPLGTATLAAGGGSGINITASVPNGPQDPIVLKSPSSVVAPQVTASGTALSCSEGTWSHDYPGSNVYGAAESYGYQWSKDGGAIDEATGSTLTTSGSGSYICTVTATNQFGATSTASAGYTVPGSETANMDPPGSATTGSDTAASTTARSETASAAAAPVIATPASLSLTSASRKKVKVVAGAVGSLSLILGNVGGKASSPSTVCATLTEKAKKGLLVPKCVSVAALPGGDSTGVTLKVKTKDSAKGAYKFSVVVVGASGSKSLAEQITVTAKKKPHKK